MNRRSFLKLAAASSAAVGFPSIVRAETLGLGGGVAPSNRITLGVIGTGSQGSGIMRNALNIGKTRVIAVCDVDAHRVAGAKKTVDDHYGKKGAGASCSTHGDFMEIVTRKDIDGVLIATPDHWHALTTIAAANHGKHVYCEKPAATTVPEGRAMLDAVERTGVVCQIGSMQRSQGYFQRAVDLALNGYLGKITRIQAGLPGGGGTENDILPVKPETVPAHLDYERWLGPVPFKPYHAKRCHWDWRWTYDFSGGELSDWIGHHYDIAAVTMGVSEMQPVSVEKVNWVSRPENPFYDTPIQFGFEAHYANGVVIECDSRFRGGVRIEGTEGWLHVNRGFIEHSSDTLKNIVIPTQNMLLSRGAGPTHMENFVECIPTGAKTRCPIREAHCVAAVAHIANAAIRSGRTSVKWNPGTESLVDSGDAARYIARAYRAPWVLPA